MVGSLIQEKDSVVEDESPDPASRRLQEHGDQGDIADLRREIAVGIEEADRGELAPFDPQATLERVRDRQATMTSQS